MLKLATLLAILMFGQNLFYEGLAHQYYMIEERMNFSSAADLCVAMGGILVEPKNPKDMEDINKFILSIYPNPKDTFWIGIQEKETYEDYYFIFDSNVTKIKFFDWNKGEPNNRFGEGCVEIVFGEDKIGKWNDKDCTRFAKGVCDFDPSHEGQKGSTPGSSTAAGTGGEVGGQEGSTTKSNTSGIGGGSGQEATTTTPEGSPGTGGGQKDLTTTSNRSPATGGSGGQKGSTTTSNKSPGTGSGGQKGSTTSSNRSPGTGGGGKKGSTTASSRSPGTDAGQKGSTTTSNKSAGGKTKSTIVQKSAEQQEPFVVSDSVMTFEEAYQFCKDRNMQVIEPRNKSFDDQLQEFITNRNMSNAYRYWIGLTDKEEEGVHRWVSDNSEVEYEHSGFNETEFQDTKDCSAYVFVIHKGWVWSEVQCTSLGFAVCSIGQYVTTLSTQTTKSNRSEELSTMPSEISSHEAKYQYNVSDETMAFQQAYQFCNNLHMHLVEPRNKTLDDQLRNFIIDNDKSNGYRYWIGVTDKKIEGGHKWISDNSNLTYENWGKNDTGFHEETKDCSAYVFVEDQEWVWSEVQCLSHAFAVCSKGEYKTTVPVQMTSSIETKVTSFSPSTTTVTRRSTLYPSTYLHSSSDVMTFKKAVRYCDSLNLQLIEPRNESLHLKMAMYAMEHLEGGFKYWIALTDMSEEGVYRWKSDNEKATFTKFGPAIGESNERRDCVALLFTLDEGWIWTDIECNETSFALCSKADFTILPPNCKPHFMYGVSEQNMTWQEAQKFCKDKGMQLLELRNRAMQKQFVSEITGKPEYDGGMWIGLSDLKEEDHFVWSSDGKVPEDLYWHDSEPNDGDAVKDEDCVEIVPFAYDFERRWNDAPCNEKKQALCEYIGIGQNGLEYVGNCTV